MELGNLEQVHTRLLEMADTVTGILERRGFHYLIAYGTLLGAVRHGGFIPWDDDLDLYLFDEEYDEALETLRRELPEGLIIHDEKTDPIYWKSWSCLRDLRSETHCSLHEDDNAFRYRGLSVDLFRLKKMPRREFNSYIHRENIEFLKKKLRSGTVEQWVYEEKLADAEAQLAEELRRLERGEGEPDEIFAFLIYKFSAAPEELLPPRKYSFEGREYYGPRNADAVLTRYYGNYMTLPAPEKRTTHYDSVDFLD